ncbi:MAG: polysaccharide biosynthesis/export family protein, partial [Kiritimatiellales bacterium]|nr:polysaccharide biosynthesis/export family protein [Kiritimatiellales bacterium]
MEKMQLHATGLRFIIAALFAGASLYVQPACAQQNTQIEVIVDQLDAMAGRQPPAETRVAQPVPPAAEQRAPRAARPADSKPVQPGEVKQLPADWFVPYKTAELKLQVGDVVDISVFRQADTVAVDVPIAPDGKLYYMFLPGIPAEGRTVGEVEEKLEKNMANLFTSPVVT